MTENKQGTKTFKHKGPATYQICIAGFVDDSLTPILGGMKITHQKTKRNDISMLIGELLDQSALNGVLNTLFSYNFTVLSVMKLNG